MRQRLPWLDWAAGELGVHETRGGETPRILWYHGHTLLKATEDEVPWCSAFMCAAMEDGAEIDSTRSAAARSWMTWGLPCELQPGAVVVFPRAGNPTQGHVALVVNVIGSVIVVLGGNQGDRVSLGTYRVGDQIACRWPKDPRFPVPA